MSRVAKAPIKLPVNVEVKEVNNELAVKGPKGTLNQKLNKLIKFECENNVVTVRPAKESMEAWALAGTFRALINNMVIGVTEGFVRELELVGVGYRAQAKGDLLSLSLGFSHPIDYKLPEGVTAETPSNTAVVLRSIDKQKLGQVAAEIRSFRPPEPYKGKGVKYKNEQIARKEAKKK